MVRKKLNHFEEPVSSGVKAIDSGCLPISTIKQYHQVTKQILDPIYEACNKVKRTVAEHWR